MSEVALRTMGLGKMYRIGGERAKYRTLRDTIAQTAKRPIERIRHPGAATHVSEVLWALRDINLEVKQGEALGIIGRNGAGKSTLLKVLSHITEPTEGRVEIRGRVASLLEVGTGFHQELTGRENIQLNGAILGMTRAEIKSRFDDIVEFSEIGRFLDTPVKRYSSGMYVRLAFAVAAHLDPEILIVDEVLSVGDAGFQKKCLGKMEDVAGSGRTIMFVSHNMQAVRSLCRSAIQIEAGRVVNSGEAGLIVADYLTQQTDTGASVTWDPGQGPGDEQARLVAVEVLDSSGNAASLICTDQPFSVRMEFDLHRLEEGFCIGFDLAASDGTVVLRTYQTDTAQEDWPDLHIGRNSVGCTVPAALLNDGRYYVMPRVSIHCQRWIAYSDSVVSFEVYRDTGLSPYTLTRPGTIAPVLPWRIM
jgi:lipopolysaccharide transport system ATP-binding protein